MSELHQLRSSEIQQVAQFLDLAASLRNHGPYKDDLEVVDIAAVSRGTSLPTSVVKSAIQVIELESTTLMERLDSARLETPRRPSWAHR